MVYVAAARVQVADLLPVSDVNPLLFELILV